MTATMFGGRNCVAVKKIFAVCVNLPLVRTLIYNCAFGSRISPVSLVTSNEECLMGLFDKLRAELIDIIEWVDDSRTTLAWRFPRYPNEIKQGAQLIVRP